MISCPVCHSSVEEEVFWTVRTQPTNENILYSTQDLAKNAPVGALRIIRCAICSHVYNSHFDEKLVNYSSDYVYLRTASDTYLKKESQVIDELSSLLKGKRANRILEVGCGDGVFLERLAQKTKGFGIGYDTSATPRIENTAEYSIELRRDFFTGDGFENEMDLVVSKQVIEHVLNPIEFLREQARSIKVGGLLYIEYPSLEWIISTESFWDFYYEHLSYFEKSAIVDYTGFLGLELVKGLDLYSGQYEGLIFEKKSETIDRKMSDLFARKNSTLAKAPFYDRWSSLKQQFQKFSLEGELIIWGGASKGMTVINSVSNELNNLVCIDIDKQKQGTYLPRSGVLIRSPEYLKNRSGTVVVMNSEYLNEVSSTVYDLSNSFEIVAIDNLR